ncbi:MULTISPECIES: DUF1440 domain-containing protein [Haloferax]|uniref:Histidine kinase n=2 Tax=Haloferax TaxID=2251 RepID=A0A6G1YZS8_9EURY|nr:MULTISPECIES: DUF1440 domain-containing protein [Haloferax]KAB1187109.1 DUF1440 domain-containing protein [Haloferax sp. CBA1149]MRW79745.1 histidine kinase [Haloferax marinisediminis]
MSTQTTARTESTLDGNWVAGVAAGAVAAIVMGAMMVMQMRPVLEVAIPSMYTLAGGTAGFTIHVAHGAILGVAFAGLAGVLGLDTTAKSLGLGIAYGVALWVVLAVLVMPVWLSAVGSPANPPLPNISTTSLVGHVVFGAVLGLAYPIFDRTM